MSEGAPHGLRRARGGEDRAEVRERRRAARLFERGERGGDILQPRDGQAALARVELLELGELVEPAAREVRIVGGGDLEGGLLAGRGAGEGGNEAEDDVEFEGAEIDAVLLRKVL
ncbi:MAG: hypothetical protein M3547_08315 [Acidobacteriota bacterium]|nr:hypothetical protein [Acidobacteriota bacterium]